MILQELNKSVFLAIQNVPKWMILSNQVTNGVQVILEENNLKLANQIKLV